ncbi:MAG: hypothetical protein U9R17_10120 [Thermodesulfobacteriota bacterium]|nr:hypothetical protein [Thermodesulfobacteriota bacterium]
MRKVAATIPNDLYKKIEEQVKLGMFSDFSEAINTALKKAYAKKSRTFLRWLIKREGIAEASMLKELENIRQ